MRFIESLKRNHFLLISTFLFIYILFNLLDGERGLFSYFEKRDLQKQLNKEKIELNNKLTDIEKKITLLTENIDLDYLEILYRDKFFFGKSNEHIYVNQSNDY